MDREELIKRLRLLDNAVFGLSPHAGDRYSCVIVGGCAFLLLGYNGRATHDIDVIIHNLPSALQGIMSGLDMNSIVRAYFDSFADDYLARVKPVPLDTKSVDFYTLSLEDLVISKIAAGRRQDKFDIFSGEVAQNIDWALLDALADEVKQSLLSSRQVQEFEGLYDEYVKGCKP
ncbi:MAG: hypothetical protein LBT60_00350 [Oscillospiraceae bacterium]|jgi:hypothetical protein|nr:hypothetical protein [Oscillospiraceae bacterium]